MTYLEIQNCKDLAGLVPKIGFICNIYWHYCLEIYHPFFIFDIYFSGIIFFGQWWIVLDFFSDINEME